MSDPKETLTITDNRTGRTYEVPVVDGSINAMELRQIRVSDDDFGLLSYDPAMKNTANCRSDITFVDGDIGILRYRGYPIEQLAEQSSFLEASWLILNGELPTASQLADWERDIAANGEVDDSIRRIIGSFDRDAHPMGMLISAVGALSTLYPEAKKITDAEVRARQIVRLIAKMPTLAAYGYRHNNDLPFVDPDESLSFPANFLKMMWGKEPDPVLARAMDVLLVLHADHEQNCSTVTMRTIGSSDADPYAAAAGAVAALYGPKHGGANEAVLRMLAEIGTADRAGDFMTRAKSGETRLMGFGHRVYKNYDPRAKIIREVAHQVFDVVGKNPLIDIAVELEKIALEDEYFISRKLYPNVDYYSGIIYQAMGFPTEMFTTLFAIGRTPGWLAHWEENVLDPEQAIIRPRQIYVGEDERPYVPVGDR